MRSGVQTPVTTKIKKMYLTLILNNSSNWNLNLNLSHYRSVTFVLNPTLPSFSYVVETAKTNVNKCHFPFSIFIVYFVYISYQRDHEYYWEPLVVPLFYITLLYATHYTICLCLLSALLTDSNLGFLLISFEKVKVQFVYLC